MSDPIYMDYAATTPVDPRVARKISACLLADDAFGNSASRSHVYGWKAEEIVEEARCCLADLVGCGPHEIIWTSGATEADNLAIKGVVDAHAGSGRHIITSMIEHKAVLDTCRHLESHHGCAVTWLHPDVGGHIEPEQVRAAVRPETVLISLMHVNNEIGTINDLAAIGRIAREAGVLFHADAAQSCGKLPIDLARLPVDLMSFSGHKMYGPKGVGALYVRRDPRVRISCQMHGGGHERGLRAGTLPTHQILGMGAAADICRREMADDIEHVRALKEIFWHGLGALPDVCVNGDPEGCYPGIFNVAFPSLAHKTRKTGPLLAGAAPFVQGELLLNALAPVLAVSSGSACTSAAVEPSYVLRALGLDEAVAHTAVRFSFGRFNTSEDMERAADAVRDLVEKLTLSTPAAEPASYLSA